MNGSNDITGMWLRTHKRPLSSGGSEGSVGNVKLGMPLDGIDNDSRVVCRSLSIALHLAHSSRLSRLAS
eukprot:23344-Eustigmatos_ZCMA.PRE.1